MMKPIVDLPKKTLFVWLLIYFVSPIMAQTDKDKVLDAMKQQVDCWNKGDIECFMEHYIKSDSLLFMGKTGITYGWQNTLNGYHSRYPDDAAMGKLQFAIIDLKTLGPTHFFMTGKFYLYREIGDLEGYFSLVWEKVGQQWLIISDHTSASN